MTRDDLEREATRRGVRDVANLTRAQLIRAIEAPPTPGAIDTAKAIFRGVLGVARTLRGRPSSPPPPPVAPAPRKADLGAPRSPAGVGDGSVTSPAPASATRSPAAVTPDPGPGAGRSGAGDTQRLRVSETPAGLPAVPRADPGESSPGFVAASAAESEPRPTRGRTEPTRRMKLSSSDEAVQVVASPAGTTQAADEPPPHDLRATAVTMDLGPLRDEVLRPLDTADALAMAAQRRAVATTVPLRVSGAGDTDEPIPTRTMARLLHEQGHHRRALAILEGLVERHPEDPALHADLTSVRKALGLTEPAQGAKHDPQARAELVTMRLPDARVLLAWGLSEASLASAKSMGATGTLVARVLVHAPSGGGTLARTLTDREVTATGEWAVGPVVSGSYVAAAVGFRDGERFTSVASAPVLEV
ncbi:MAG: hypothetical protein R3B40_06630 [Polyangiales bacterium]|nr:hypothetical protein [Sandaracinaceae bacterium]